MKQLKKLLTIATSAIFILTICTQIQLDQNSRKKGPPFNDEGPGGSGKRLQVSSL